MSLAIFVYVQYEYCRADEMGEHIQLLQACENSFSNDSKTLDEYLPNSFAVYAYMRSQTHANEPFLLLLELRQKMPLANTLLLRGHRENASNGIRVFTSAHSIWLECSCSCLLFANDEEAGEKKEAQHRNVPVSAVKEMKI